MLKTDAQQKSSTPFLGPYMHAPTSRGPPTQEYMYSKKIGWFGRNARAFRGLVRPSYEWNSMKNDLRRIAECIIFILHRWVLVSGKALTLGVNLINSIKSWQKFNQAVTKIQSSHDTNQEISEKRHVQYLYRFVANPQKQKLKQNKLAVLVPPSSIKIPLNSFAVAEILQEVANALSQEDHVSGSCCP